MKNRLAAPAALDLDALPSLFEQVKLTGNASADAAAILALTEVDKPGNKLIKSRGALPSLELGIKASSTTRQWREQEKKMHKKSVRNMQSPTKREVMAHMHDLDRSSQILSFGSKNKANAIMLHLNKIKRENSEFARRLVKIQKTTTEITETNKPGMQRNRQAVNERMKYLAMARHAAQTRLDFENSLILKRLATANPTVPTQPELKAVHKRNRRIRRNMCKLAVPPHEHDRFVEAKKRRAEEVRRRREIQQKGGNSALSGTGVSQHESIGARGTAISRQSRRKKSRQTRTSSSRQSRLSNHGLSRGSQRSLPRSQLVPLQGRTLDKTASEPWLVERDSLALPLNAQRPISRAHDQALAIPQSDPDEIYGARTVLSSNQDRGQICHEWVVVKQVVPGEPPMQKRALLIGFKKPNEEGKLIFELSFEQTTRYAAVTYEQMRAALEEAAAIAEANSPPGEQVPPKSFSMAQAAAMRLTLFGSPALGETALVWNEV